MSEEFKGGWRKLTKSLSRFAMVVLVLTGLVPAAHAHTGAGASVSDRVGRIRIALRDRMQGPAAASAQNEQAGVKLAQWGNAWQNWNNWDNWHNWYNWGNWGNWGNGG
jgi:hypothetical protein